MDINAQAKNNLTLGANVSALNMLGSINASWNIAPSAALNIGSSKTDATVKVDGTVTADAGRGDIEALGDNTFDGSAVIGAGSVVTKDIPSNVTAFGNPCKVIRQITDEDKKYWNKLKEDRIEFMKK